MIGSNASTGMITTNSSGKNSARMQTSFQNAARSPDDVATIATFITRFPTVCPRVNSQYPLRIR